MKKSRYFLLGVAMLGLSGCDYFSTPDGAIKTFAHALKENDTELYTQALTGEALEKCGTLRGMMAVQDELRKFKNTSYATPALVGSTQDPLGHDIERVYEVLIHGSNPEIPYELNWKFTVSCEMTYSTGAWDPINHEQQDPVYTSNCRIARMAGVFCGNPQ